MSDKTRYSDEELQEFKELILQKLDKAQKEYDSLRGLINNTDGNDTADTSPTFKILEEGASTLSKEASSHSVRKSSSSICRTPLSVSRTRPTASAARQVS